MPARWSAREDRTLRRLYARNAPVSEIATRLGRSGDAVVARRSALAIPARPRSRPWTAWEETLLRATVSAGLPLSVIAARLDRSRDQVRTRSRHLLRPRPPARPYAASEDEAIRHSSTVGEDLEAVARRLGRSADAVRLRAQRLGVHEPRKRFRWQEWEDVLVRDGYTAALTCAEIAAQLPRRTASGVSARARRLGVATYARRWSAGDDQQLAQLLAVGVPVEQAALELGRTPEAIRQRAARRGMVRRASGQEPRDSRRWTPEEDQLLRLHPTLNPARLAQLLNRSDRAICQRLRMLGARARSSRTPHYTGPSGGRAPSRLGSGALTS